MQDVNTNLTVTRHKIQLFDKGGRDKQVVLVACNNV
jgi:hypothetical protein